jgi:hypothetical protein
MPEAPDGDTVAVSGTSAENTEMPVSVVRVVVVAYFTTCMATAADVLRFSAPSPEYAAVIEWLPAVSAVVESTAMPPFTATVPIASAPSRNWTVPVAVEGVTVAVNVALCPTFNGDAGPVSVVVEFAFATVCTTGADVLPASASSPPYTAVSEFEPAGRFVTAICADPFARAADPRTVAPFRNCTVPVDDEGDTVAVSITVMPTVDGFGALAMAVVVARFTTCCGIAADWLGLKLPSPR